MSVAGLAHAYGIPEVHATVRRQPEDFFVDEVLGFEPDGDGEHIYVQIEKRGQNTRWVASQLARAAGLKNNDVGYCGLKDRHAVTRQWYSLYCPRQPSLDWDALVIDGCEFLGVSRHRRKLRPGDHRANRFAIRLRDVSDSDALRARLQPVAGGVPNYFGEQRFGIDNHNLDLAEQLLTRKRAINDKKLRGLVLSAARAYLFNQVLSHRVQQQNWREAFDGDPAAPESSGPLWGRGRPLASGALAELERVVLEPWAHWCDGLEHVGLKQERRALVCVPQEFDMQWDGVDCLVHFTLPPGQYATAVLRELALTTNAAERV